MENQKTENRGGARKGAGRKPVDVKKPPKYKTLSISLLPEEWAQLDAMRGDMSRSSYVAVKLGLRSPAK